MTLEQHDLALMTARFGAARFGATRFGFIPCPEDVVGPPDPDPGLYVWREQTPESQIVDTPWVIQNEDCACRDLCTLAIGTMTTSPNPPTVGASFTLTIPLSGVLGLVQGVIRIHWGDGSHDSYEIETLEGGDLQYTYIYSATGPATISVDITDERGCRTEQTLGVTVGVEVQAVYFTWNQNAESSTVSFTAHYGVLNVLTFDWDFGEGGGYELDVGDPINNVYGGSGEDDTYLVKLRVNAVEGVFEDTFLMTTNWAAGQSGSSQ